MKKKKKKRKEEKKKKRIRCRPSEAHAANQRMTDPAEKVSRVHEDLVGNEVGSIRKCSFCRSRSTRLSYPSEMACQICWAGERIGQLVTQRFSMRSREA